MPAPNLLLLLFITSLWLPVAAPAAVISISPDDESKVILSGSIEIGDTEKLLKLLASRKHPRDYLHLNSPGGSLEEALKLARIVERASLDTRVEGLCASACFFVWLAGSPRVASGAEFMNNPHFKAGRRADGTVAGFIGLHRPFLSSPQQAPNSRQAALMRSVGDYLEEKLVPKRLTDTMMSRPSNDIYWLTSEDLKLIGRYSAPLEEYLIQKCGYDRNAAERYLDTRDAGRLAEASILRATIDQTRLCEGEELLRLRTLGRSAIGQ